MNISKYMMLALIASAVTQAFASEVSDEAYNHKNYDTYVRKNNQDIKYSNLIDLKLLCKNLRYFQDINNGSKKWPLGNRIIENIKSLDQPTKDLVVQKTKNYLIAQEDKIQQLQQARLSKKISLASYGILGCMASMALLAVSYIMEDIKFFTGAVGSMVIPMGLSGYLLAMAHEPDHENYLLSKINQFKQTQHNN